MAADQTDLRTGAAEVPLSNIFASFLKLGSTTFGGGSVGWINREVVDRRRWISEERFMQMLTVALAMPGANPVNLATYVGLELRGYVGAVVAVLGMVAAPFVIILLFAVSYSQLAQYDHARAILSGLACVGVSAMMLTGLKSAGRIKTNPVSVLIALAVFVAVAVLRLPMIEVVVVAIPASVAAAWWQGRGPRHG